MQKVPTWLLRLRRGPKIEALKPPKPNTPKDSKALYNPQNVTPKRPGPDIVDVYVNFYYVGPWTLREYRGPDDFGGISKFHYREHYGGFRV